MGEGGGLSPRGLITQCIFFCCLQVNGSVTIGTCKWGERGLISVGAYNRVHCFVYR